MVNFTADSIKVLAKDRTSKNGVPYTQYSLMIASKDKEDNWNNAFLDCNFKKDDKTKITDKCKIKINKCFPTVEKFGEKTSIRWMITDFEVLEGATPAEQPQTPADNGFINLSMDVADEGLPFR